MKTDYRYSNTLVYNTFPIPDLLADQKAVLEGHTVEILGAREAHPGKTIAWLYDPETMPGNLLKAHKELDDALEQMYIGRPFKNDTERLEHLFKLYANMIKKEQAVKATKQPKLISNGHGKVATPDNKTHHARSPHPNPLPQAGEGANESLREFNVTGDT